MTEPKQGADPKLIVAIQMVSIGVILIILGVTVYLRSPIGKMAPFFRLNSILSTGAIFVTGVLFFIGGYIRYRKTKKK